MTPSRPAVTAIVDTHAAVWYLKGDARLSSTARAKIDQPADGNTVVGVSALSLVEIVYLVEKGRLSLEDYEILAQTLKDNDTVLVELPVTNEIAETMRSVSRDAIPDMTDRVLAATAVYMGVPLITRDEQIRASKVRTIW